MYSSSIYHLSLVIIWSCIDATRPIPPNVWRHSPASYQISSNPRRNGRGRKEPRAKAAGPRFVATNLQQANHSTALEGPVPHHNSQFSSESPPQEPPSDEIMAEAPDSPPAEYTGNNSASASSASNSQINGEAGPKAAHSTAGSTWNNKKFQEEYQRAEGQLADQNWDASKYCLLTPVPRMSLISI